MMRIFLFLLMVATVFLQASFLSSFVFLRSLPPLFLLVALALLLYEKRFLPAFMAVVFAGFVADALSSHFFGFWMIAAAGTVIFGHWLLNSYGRFPIFTKG